MSVLISFILVLIFSCISPLSVLAETNNSNDYLEFHNQVDFNDIDYAIYNKSNLLLSIDNNKNLFKKIKLKKI